MSFSWIQTKTKVRHSLKTKSKSDVSSSRLDFAVWICSQFREISRQCIVNNKKTRQKQKGRALALSNETADIGFGAARPNFMHRRTLSQHGTGMPTKVHHLEKKKRVSRRSIQ